ncbi:MAG: peptide-methionine (S)-S-oxide reductase [Gammaproteobacteria bacterium]|jgi:peptide-methionine (S)-S-oxide reductase|nr:peptide-methionine (S)-S-oxide reductase [Gammaproteobacteria bacterium]
MTSSTLRSAKRSILPTLLAVLGVAWQLTSCAAEAPVNVPPPATDNPKQQGPLQTAVLSGGCFWGVQGVYEHVKGVKKVVSGYAGGDRTTARYETVGTGSTGHAESVQITFDPAKVSYGELLQVFFSVAHDPTQLNRQGPDTGSQYRSMISYRDDTQKNIADAYIAQLGKAGVFQRPIVTKVDPLKGFYPAEGYHQDYLAHNPSDPYIAYNDLPKIESLKRLFPDYYSQRPVLLSQWASR